MKVTRSYETPVLKTATRRNIPEDGTIIGALFGTATIYTGTAF
jgi:hypothetical protein